MALVVDHPMSSPSVCSRREPSKIAQGKRSAALSKRQRGRIRPIGAGRMLSRRIAESSHGATASHRPYGAGIYRGNAFPGFHPGLFSPPPSRRKCAAFRRYSLHLELLLTRLRDRQGNSPSGAALSSLSRGGRLSPPMRKQRGGRYQRNQPVHGGGGKVLERPPIV